MAIDLLWVSSFSLASFLEAIPWQIFINLMAVMSLIITLYSNVYVPWREAKPELEFFTTPHYIGENTAVNSMLIRNKGDGAATNIGIYCELKRPHKIKDIRSNLKYNPVEGGKGDWRVKMTWDRLEPKNSINVVLLIEADPMDISSVIPEILRVWSDKGIIEEQGISS